MQPSFAFRYPHRHVEGFAGVVAFSDPMPRTTATGATVFVGHVGQIYTASSAVLLGRSHADTIHLLPDGRVFSRRALTKIRRQETGWRYAVEQLVAAGADAPSEDLDAWLSNALAQVTRRVRHPGNFKYAVPLTRCARKALPASLPYPRVSRAALDACPTIEGGSCVSPGV